MSRKRIAWLLGSTLSAVVLVGFMLHLEPFAPRYKGRTVGQWLDFYSRSKNFPIDPSLEVIAAFGTNAFKPLIKTKPLPAWAVAGIKVAQFLRRDQVPDLKAIRKSYLATMWAGKLFEINPGLAQNLLTNNPDDDFVLEAVDLPHSAKKGAGLEMLVKDPDERVRTRAAKLLKQNGNWDEATYRKWLNNSK
jgi:hypothetical protein